MVQPRAAKSSDVLKEVWPPTWQLQCLVGCKPQQQAQQARCELATLGPWNARAF